MARHQSLPILCILLLIAGTAPVKPSPINTSNWDQLGDGAEDHQEHHGDQHKGFRVFVVDLFHVQTPFIIGMCIFFASLAKTLFRMVPKLADIIPESCLLIVVGLIVGLVLLLTDNIGALPLTPTTFFLFLLPPIILDAGYFMPNRAFFDHLGTIILFAVLGTIWNTVTIGLSLWGVGLTGAYGMEMPILNTFLFSSLISAVDPVAVLAVFEEIHVNEILYIIVFGESLLNDAVTVVLYNMFDAYVELGPENIGYQDVLSGFSSFLVVALGGTLIGIVWGFLTGFVTRFTNHVRIIEPIFIFIMSYLAYLNAEIFHMSGILAIMFCGLTMKNYVEANISSKSHTTVKYAMKMLSSSSETIIFMLLGVNTIHDQHDWNMVFIILTILFCSVFRVIGCIMLGYIANRFRLQKLNSVEKFVMSYGGLRGAVAFALVLLIDKNKVPEQPLFVTATISVVFFTVFIQGTTIKPLVKLLNVRLASKFKKTMNERIHEKLMDYTMVGIEDVIGGVDSIKIRARFKQIDYRYIRPMLVRDHRAHEPKILETFSKLSKKEAMENIQRGSFSTSNCEPESLAVLFRRLAAKNTSKTGADQVPINQGLNLDIGELAYNPSARDLSDAKIHHLLSEELWKPQHFGRRFRKMKCSLSCIAEQDLPYDQLKHKLYVEHFNRNKRLCRHHPGCTPKNVSHWKSIETLRENGSCKKFHDDYVHSLISEVCDTQGQIGFGGEHQQTRSRKPSEDPEMSSPLSLVETQLPWKRSAVYPLDNSPVKQTEFRLWVENLDCFERDPPVNTFSSDSDGDNSDSSVIDMFGATNYLTSSPRYSSSSSPSSSTCLVDADDQSVTVQIHIEDESV